MERQLLLRLAFADQERLQQLWQQLPEDCQTKLSEQFATLIARATCDASSPQQEASDEPEE